MTSTFDWLSLGARTAAPFRLHTALAILGLAACTTPDEPSLGETRSAISVGGAVSGSCSTSTVLGLAKQIANEVDCMSNGNLAPLHASSRLVFTSKAVMPYLNPSAVSSLVAAGNQATLQINSGYRTVAQQYLLYRWYRAGRCGIPIAATPGTSNHEGGRAVDVANWSSRVSVMRAHGWSHDVPGDSVHFDHLSSPSERGTDVKAFQRLWNRNHPADKIAEDGAYGPQTGARLAKAPATGFPKGACGVVRSPIEIAAIAGPDIVAPTTQAHYTLTLNNTEDVDWPATAKIVVADGSASPLYDSATWTSPSELGAIATAIPAGQQGVVDLDVMTPAMPSDAPDATSYTTTFAVVDGARVIDTFDLSVMVAPNATPDQSADSGDTDVDNDPNADENGASPDGGGCNAGGSASWMMLGLPLLVVRRRRPRAC